MTQEVIRTLTDAELNQIEGWVQSERKARTERRKQEAIAKIKELAGTVGVSVAIGGVRGRPARVRAKPSLKG